MADPKIERNYGENWKFREIGGEIYVAVSGTNSNGSIDVNVISGIRSQQEENRLGSECSGSSGATGRVLTLQNTSLSYQPTSIWVDDQLIAISDYTTNHLASSSTITFDNINIYDSQTIRVIYYV